MRQLFIFSRLFSSSAGAVFYFVIDFLSDVGSHIGTIFPAHTVSVLLNLHTTYTLPQIHSFVFFIRVQKFMILVLTYNLSFDFPSVCKTRFFSEYWRCSFSRICRISSTFFRNSLASLAILARSASWKFLLPCRIQFSFAISHLSLRNCKHLLKPNNNTIVESLMHQ